jgi:hypothetical protein
MGLRRFVRLSPSCSVATIASKAAAVTAMRIMRRRYFVGRRGLA